LELGAEAKGRQRKKTIADQSMMQNVRISQWKGMG
jgi:hypothetical protein